VTNNEDTETNAMTNWLTLEEAAKYLKMGKSTLYDLARKGNIPAHKMGREWRFDSEEVDEWLKASKLALREQRER
jgi:excisionase family DNA binding protein